MVSEEESWGARRDDWQQDSSVFQTQQDWSTYALTETAQAWARWVPSMRRGSGHALPPIPRLHLQPTTAHKGKINFSPRVALGIQITLNAPWSAMMATKRAQWCFCGFFSVSCRFVCAIFTLQSFVHVFWLQILWFYVLCFLWFFVSCFFFIFKFPYLFSKDTERKTV